MGLVESLSLGARESTDRHTHVTLSEGVRERVEGSPQGRDSFFASIAILVVWGHLQRRSLSSLKQLNSAVSKAAPLGTTGMMFSTDLT